MRSALREQEFTRPIDGGSIPCATQHAGCLLDLRQGGSRETATAINCRRRSQPASPQRRSHRSRHWQAGHPGIRFRIRPISDRFRTADDAVAQRVSHRMGAIQPWWIVSSLRRAGETGHNRPDIPVLSASDSDAKVATSHPTHERSPPMTYQVDEREAPQGVRAPPPDHRLFHQRRGIGSSAGHSPLFNFHVLGLGEVETPASQPNYGNAAPCAVKDSSGKAQYVSNASVGIRVMNGTSHGQFAKAVGARFERQSWIQRAENR